MFLSSLLAPLLSGCMLLGARAAVMLPYSVERIPVQRAWETLSAEHFHDLGIDPESVFSLQRSRPPAYLCLIRYGSQSEKLFKLATVNPGRAVTLFSQCWRTGWRAIVSWKISLLAAEQVSIL